MPHALLDENVSLQVGSRLRALGYEVESIAQHPQRGMDDQEVFALTVERSSLLVTRDAHFTNHLRFPPDQTSGILFITAGNLRGRQEADLVDSFLRTHAREAFAGRLAIISLVGTIIR